MKYYEVSLFSFSFYEPPTIPTIFEYRNHSKHLFQFPCLIRVLLLLFLLQDAEECQLATSAAGTPCQVICIQYVEWRYIVLHLEIHVCCVFKKG